jgi:hypothetical protein
MLTSYNLYFTNINFSLENNETLRREGGNQESISVGSSLSIYDLHNFSDRMDANPSLFSEKCEGEVFSMVAGGIGTFSNDQQLAFLGYENVIRWRDSVTKAMIISLLDGDSKRTVAIGTNTLLEKKDIFYNTLILDELKDHNIKPWNNWNETYSTINPISVSRNSNVTTVITSPPHGLSTSFDDWGIVMNINNNDNGISTSFNISTSIHPNGIPIRIINSTTFEYDNIGINTSLSIIDGTADVKVGWGGSSINLHLFFT